MTNLDEAVGEYVEKEAATKLLNRDRDVLPVLGAKTNAARVERGDAVVGDADAMGVLADWPRYLKTCSGPANGRLA